MGGIYMKPCPFCGGRAFINKRCTTLTLYQVLCKACGAKSGTGCDQFAAIDNWNRRYKHED